MDKIIQGFFVAFFFTLGILYLVPVITDKTYVFIFISALYFWLTLVVIRQEKMFKSHKSNA